MRDFTFPIPEFRKSKFRPWMLGLLFLGAAILVACPTDCNENAITGPTVPIPDTPDPGPEPDPEPVFNSGSYWAPGEWGDGVTGFGLCAKSPQEQKRFHRSYLNHGYEYTRILSETGMWQGYWEANGARGPQVGAGAIESFEQCLRIAAESGGKLLIAVVATTHRDRGNPTQREKWVLKVIKAAKGYTNLRWEVTNEYDHPRSKLQGQYAELNKYAKYLRRWGGLVSTDQGIGAIFKSQPHRYAYDFGRLKMDFPDFHPPRNPDPDRSDILDIIKANGNRKDVLLGETTSWVESEADIEIFGWLVTTSRTQIQTYMNNCRPSDGCHFVYHSVPGLLGVPPTWYPKRGMFSRSLEIEMENGRPVYVDGRQGTRRPLFSWNDF